MSHEASKQVYTDGAIYHNNPIVIADQERKLLWPSLSEGPPDIIVSIGTSYNPDSVNRESMQRSTSLKLGVINQARNLLKIAKDHVASSLDSEKTWHNYLEVLNPSEKYRNRYVRLNPRVATDPPPLDAVDQLQRMQDATRTAMIRDPDIRRTALRLIATCFYFENSSQTETCKGLGSVREITGKLSVHIFYMNF